MVRAQAAIEINHSSKGKIAIGYSAEEKNLIKKKLCSMKKYITINSKIVRLSKMEAA